MFSGYYLNRIRYEDVILKVVGWDYWDSVANQYYFDTFLLFFFLHYLFGPTQSPPPRSKVSEVSFVIEAISLNPSSRLRTLIYLCVFLPSCSVIGYWRI